MDDIDEGIGSNESSLCNKDNANVLDELKGLNKKASDITKDSNGISQNLETRFSPNGKFKDGSDKVCEDSNINGDSLQSELKGDDKVNGVDDLSSDRHDLMKVEKDDAIETKHEILENDSEIVPIKKEKGLDSEAILENTTEIIDKSSTSVDIKVEKQENIELETEQQSANNGDSDKNLFHISLDDKLRNSLKGLVAKVKSSEPVKDCANSENTIEKEESKSGIKLEGDAQEIKSEIIEKTKATDELNSDENSDALLLENSDQDEEGIFMDLGSDCEELDDSLLSESPKAANDITDNSEVDNSESIDSENTDKVVNKKSVDNEVTDGNNVKPSNEDIAGTSLEPVNDTKSVLTDKTTSLDSLEETCMEVTENLIEPKVKSSDTDHNFDSVETNSDKMVVRNSAQENNGLSVDSACEDDVIFQKITTVHDKTDSVTENSNKEKLDSKNDFKISNGPNVDSLDDSDVIIVPESITEDTNDDSNDKLSNATSDNENISELKDDEGVDNNDDKKLKANETSDTSSSIGDRKRAASDTDICESDLKRKKTNITNGISNHDNQNEPASIELSDSDDGEIEDVKDSKSHTTDTCIKQSGEEKGPKKITITEEELDSMVRERVKVYLASQQSSLIAKLAQKIKDLQTTNDLWKRQVKDLQIKVSEVTVLQQKHEKRKAACNALRQIRTRHVAVQVDNGKTSSRPKPVKEVSTPPKTPQAPMVVTPGPGTGTIRLPVPHASMNSQKSPGNKPIDPNYKTPSVKSLLDTTKVQKTVGSINSPPASVATSIIGLVQYQPNFLPKNSVTQGYATVTQALVTQGLTVNNSVAKMQTKTLSVSSPSAKIIDLTDDDDSKNQGRFLAVHPGMSPRTVLTPGTQLVRAGLPNQQTYQVVFSPQSQGVRPGTVSMATAISQTPLLAGMQPVQLATAQQPQRPNLTPGTTMARAAVLASPATVQSSGTHPAPLPVNTKVHKTAGLKAMLPKPVLSISRVSLGIVLSWTMSINDSHAKVSNYQLFAYQETSAPPVYSLWKKVGDVKALPLPMACTLTQFQVGNKYHFAVRAVDEHQREGQFSDPGSINLTPNTSAR